MRKFSLMIFFCFVALAFHRNFLQRVYRCPYFSIWSPANNLYDSETDHWTSKEQPMHSIVRIDGKTFRLIGSQPASFEKLKPERLKIL